MKEVGKLCTVPTGNEVRGMLDFDMIVNSFTLLSFLFQSLNILLLRYRECWLLI